MIPRAKMYSFKSFEVPGSQEPKDNDGPIIDAHQTPDGWSVDPD